MLKKGSWKSVNRKPLGDISNGGRPSRDGKKKIQLDRDDDGGYFDRLILVRSTLSALVNQKRDLTTVPFIYMRLFLFLKL
ncbi:hypothetical protein MA16_Dca001385 [Dendrobium catenatum]|uniref:Uncharacterized protein n=1 Tax=Dendrobium catenatum TaxID=906689 RepID=A0A2I0WM86_9ASPA|nr:hypothetical protein MA16_Dca001385 [Dendrobium catenatum]